MSKALQFFKDLDSPEELIEYIRRNQTALAPDYVLARAPGRLLGTEVVRFAEKSARLLAALFSNPELPSGLLNNTVKRALTEISQTDNMVSDGTLQGRIIWGLSDAGSRLRLGDEERKMLLDLAATAGGESESDYWNLPHRARKASGILEPALTEGEMTHVAPYISPEDSGEIAQNFLRLPNAKAEHFATVLANFINHPPEASDLAVWIIGETPFKDDVGVRRQLMHVDSVQVATHLIAVLEGGELGKFLLILRERQPIILETAITQKRISPERLSKVPAKYLEALLTSENRSVRMAAISAIGKQEDKQLKTDSTQIRNRSV